ncbi:MAG: HAD hydrolase family protein [Pyrinomonadaceae bacterium]|nr:HAD hydrolase family protein [Pyrinomonadaceae bacterium]
MSDGKITDEIIKRAQKIKLLLMDCDGVLTDGKLYFSANGEELKVFHVRDGQGIVSWHKAGFTSGIISGRNSPIVEKRATELGIRYIKQGSINKIEDFENIIDEAGVSADEAAFVGDDLPDIDLLERVGLSFAVADAEEEVKRAVLYITNSKGGFGAVREITNLLLKLKS